GAPDPLADERGRSLRSPAGGGGGARTDRNTRGAASASAEPSARTTGFQSRLPRRQSRRDDRAEPAPSWHLQLLPRQRSVPLADRGPRLGRDRLSGRLGRDRPPALRQRPPS